METNELKAFYELLRNEFIRIAKMPGADSVMIDVCYREFENRFREYIKEIA